VTTSTFTADYLREASAIIEQLEQVAIERIMDLLVRLRDSDGRLFFVGVGGGAGYASHAVNDFRKIANIESYSPSDNVSELTARTNDDGWNTVYAAWLAGSRLRANDMVFVFSVGGGDLERNISPQPGPHGRLREERGCHGGAGRRTRRGGYTARVADVCVVVPTVNPGNITASHRGAPARAAHVKQVAGYGDPGALTARQPWKVER
jgi:D-sedoheptulose 7-phosphate isomerase